MLPLVLLLSAAVNAAPADPPPPISFCYEGDLQNARVPQLQIGPYQVFGDIAGRVALAVQQLQLPATFHKMPWRRCLKAVADGSIDAAFAIAWTKERATSLIYPDGLPAQRPHPLRMYQIRYVIYRKKGGQIDWDGQQFSQIRNGVAAPQGYAAEKQLAELGVLNPVNLDTASALKLVANDRLDAFVFPDNTVASVLHNHPDADRLEPMPHFFSQTDVFLVFSPTFAQRSSAVMQALWHHQQIATNGPVTPLSSGHTEMLTHPLRQTQTSL